MKNIQRKLQKFQTILNFIFNLLFCESAETQVKSTIIFDVPVNRERRTLQGALSAFELKKQGGAR